MVREQASQHAALAELNIVVVLADDARALGYEQDAPRRAVIDILRHLRGDLARKVGSDAGDQRGRDDGAGLQNRGGFIWVNKKRNWIEDMEIALPDNPDWTSFKFKLLKTETMTRDAWEKFIAAQF